MSLLSTSRRMANLLISCSHVSTPCCVQALLCTASYTAVMKGQVLVAEPAAAWQSEHSRERTISLFDRQGASAAAYTRIFCLLGLVQELLLSNQQASQRDVYYRSANALVLLFPRSN